jgi:hypothetical protein
MIIQNRAHHYDIGCRPIPDLNVRPHLVERTEIERQFVVREMHDDGMGEVA